MLPNRCHIYIQLNNINNVKFRIFLKYRKIYFFFDLFFLLASESDSGSQVGIDQTHICYPIANSQFLVFTKSNIFINVIMIVQKFIRIYTQINTAIYSVDSEINTAVYIIDAEINTAVYIVDAEINTAVYILDAEINTAVCIVDAEINTAVYILDAEINTAVYILDAEINTAVCIVDAEINTAVYILDAEINTAVYIVALLSC